MLSRGWNKSRGVRVIRTQLTISAATKNLSHGWIAQVYLWLVKFTDRGIRSLIDASITPAIWGTSRHARCLRQISAYQLTPHEPQICLDHFSQVYSEQLIALLSLGDHIRVAPWQSTHDKFLALYPGCVSLLPCGLGARSSYIPPSSFIVRSLTILCKMPNRAWFARLPRLQFLIAWGRRLGESYHVIRGMASHVANADSPPSLKRVVQPLQLSFQCTYWTHTNL